MEAFLVLLFLGLFVFGPLAVVAQVISLRGRVDKLEYDVGRLAATPRTGKRDNPRKLGLEA